MFDNEFQGLTVLEYLVAHGSERVVDDIREHAYQISVSFLILVKFVKSCEIFCQIVESGENN